jgi:hypothetical protein
MNNSTRHPRTMQSAFGPYTDSILYPMRDPARPRLWVWIVVYLTAAIVLALTF